MREYSDTIINWAKLHEKEILDYQSYRYEGKTYQESVQSRNELEEAISLSRQKNNGGIDLATADKICRWGFNRNFPIRNENTVLEATREAFKFFDRGDYYQACKRLLWLYKVGVARATKILGLSDQENACIYDSRVGTALRDLTKNGSRIILCPIGQTRVGDQMSDDVKAENYEKLIWTLEIIRDHFKKKSLNLKLSEIEMSLFMMGK